MTKFEDHLKQLKEKYLAGLNLKMEAMRHFHQQGDLDSLRAELHKIKGTGLTYGFPEISQICRLFEQLVKKGEKDSFEMSFSLLEKVLFDRQRNKIYPLQEDKAFLKLQASVPEKPEQLGKSEQLDREKKRNIA